MWRLAEKDGFMLRGEQPIPLCLVRLNLLCDLGSLVRPTRPPPAIEENKTVSMRSGILIVTSLGIV
jgi:hypothetical protein